MPLNSTLKKTAFFSLLMFAGTLTNALFFNQLGYYIALVLLSVAYFRGEKILFKRTGLEPWLLLFVAAEIMSLIFTENKAQALEFGFKRVILLPIIYTIASGISDLRQLRIFFYTYLVFALGSDLLYIGFSIEYFIRDLYKYTSEGPSVLLHPITTGELTSFTALFLFSLFLNEKRLKWKAGWLILSLISFASLLATFKRTAWIGLGLGLLVMLILNRNYIIIALSLAVFIVMIYFAKNESKVYIFDLEGKKITEFSTTGFAYKVQPIGDELVVSDHVDGLKIYKKDSLVSHLETPGPVYEIVKWGDDYAAFLSDYRILLLGKKDSGFVIKKEFISPGYLGRLAVNKGMLYTVDSDSGISVFRSTADIGKPLRFPQFARGISMVTDTNYINIIYSDYIHTTIRLDSNGMPVDTVAYDKKIPSGTNFLGFIKGKPLYYFNKGFYWGDPQTGKFKYLPPNTDCRGIAYSTVASGTDSIYLVGNDRNLYNLSVSGDTSVYLRKISAAGFYPFSLTASEKYICMTDIKKSRILSFFDLTGESNRNRLSMWRIGWEIFLDHPFFGVGDIDLAKIFKQYNRPHEKEIKGHLHNNFFHILATLGGFGIISILILFYMIIRTGFRVFHMTSSKTFERAVVMGSLACIAAFIGAGLTEFNFGDHEIITMMWFSTGLVFTVKQILIKNDEQK
ncbi:MAG: O-antigen ligase family protein [Ignavibacteria bacterium]|nr:O-antigen ligase family protein [Ignavibacteria bacterium]